MVMEDPQRQPMIAPRERVDDEPDIHPPRPRRDVGDVGYPETVRGVRGEVPAHQVPCPRGGRVGERCPLDLAADCAGQAFLAHQPLDRAPGHLDALPVQRQPNLPRPVDTVVRGVDAADLVDEHGIAVVMTGGRLGHVLVVRRRGDRQPVLSEHRADRLDTPAQATVIARLTAVGVLTDEVHDQWEGRSSSAAKKAEAAFKIEFALRSSAFSRFNRFSSTDCSLVTPTRTL